MQHDSPLATMLAPLEANLSTELAEALAGLRANESFEQRLDVLAEKATEGTLTPAEQAEYQSYVDALDVMGVIQLQAQRVLQGAQTAE